MNCFENNYSFTLMLEKKRIKFQRLLINEEVDNKT